MKVSSPLTQDKANTSTVSTNVSTQSTDSTQDTEDEPQPGTELDKDAIFSLLKNHRRRKVLRYLAAHQGEATIGPVAEHIAAIENDTTVQQINSQQRKRVYVALYQCHLPMLDDHGVISFNRPRGQLELAPSATQLEPYLDDTEPDTERWNDYLITTVFGGLLYLFGTLLVGPGSWFTTATIVGVLISLTVLTLTKYYSDIVTAVRASAHTVMPQNLKTRGVSEPGDSSSAPTDTLADD